MDDLAGALRRFEREGAVVVVPSVRDPIQRVEVCLLRLAGDLQIELVAPFPGETGPLAARLGRGGGLDHLCFAVPALEPALELELAQGALLLCPPCHAVAFGRRIAFVQRRSGLVVELLETP